MDPTVIDRARGGDSAALEAVLLEVMPSVERFARRLCAGPDVDDVLQETLVSVVTNLKSFEGRSSLASWVFTITRTACSRQRRGLKNRPHDGDEAVAAMADSAPDPEQSAAVDELSRSLAKALDALPPEHREVIVLRDVEGLTAPEAAASLGLTVEALKSRLHRARAGLREALRPAMEAPSGGARCPDVVALWSRRLEGDLTPEDCAAMERHLEGCPSCGAACEVLKRTLWACQRSGAGEVSPSLRGQIRRAVLALGAPGGD